MIRTKTARWLAGLALVGTFAAAGLGMGNNQAHAAVTISPCYQIYCDHNPRVTITGGLGELQIQGVNWPANQWVEINIYAPVNSTIPDVVTYHMMTDTSGSFYILYVAQGHCFTQKMEIQAFDSTSSTSNTQFVAPGCLRVSVPLK